MNWARARRSVGRPRLRPRSGRLVVVAAAGDGVSHPSHHRQEQADGEEDDPKDQNNMGEGEGRDEAGEDEPDDEEDDSENDHDVYLSFSVNVLGGGLPGSVLEG